MAQERLAVEVKIEGADDAVSDLQGVSQASDKLGESASKAADAERKFEQSSNASAEGLSALKATLSAIHPSLGQYAELLLKGKAALDQFGAAQRQTAAAGEAAGGGILSVFRALNPMTIAVGAAVVSIGILIKVFQQVKEEATKASEAINRFNDAQNQTLGQRQSQQEVIDQLLITRGNISDAASRKALAISGRLQGAAEGGTLGGTGFSKEASAIAGALSVDASGKELFGAEQIEFIAALAEGGIIRPDATTESIQAAFSVPDLIDRARRVRQFRRDRQGLFRDQLNRQLQGGTVESRDVFSGQLLGQDAIPVAGLEVRQYLKSAYGIGDNDVEDVLKLLAASNTIGNRPEDSTRTNNLRRRQIVDDIANPLAEKIVEQLQRGVGGVRPASPIIYNQTINNREVHVGAADPSKPTGPTEAFLDGSS